MTHSSVIVCTAINQQGIASDRQVLFLASWEVLYASWTLSSLTDVVLTHACKGLLCMPGPQWVQMGVALYNYKIQGLGQHLFPCPQCSQKSEKKHSHWKQQLLIHWKNPCPNSCRCTGVWLAALKTAYLMAFFQVVFVDQSRDLWIRPVAGKSPVVKLASMVDCAVWHDSLGMLAFIADHKLVGLVVCLHVQLQIRPYLCPRVLIWSKVGTNSDQIRMPEVFPEETCFENDSGRLSFYCCIWLTLHNILARLSSALFSRGAVHSSAGVC